MPQFHLYLPQDVAQEVRRRAELSNMSVSAFLASIVKAELASEWPPGYLDEVIGSFAEHPIERPSQGEFEGREPLQ